MDNPKGGQIGFGSLAIPTVGLAVACLIAWFWSVRPENAGVFNAVAMVMSVAGLYVSVAGFSIALAQIQRSLTASEAAKSALAEIKTKLSSLNASSEIEKARLALETADKELFAGRYRDAPLSLNAVRIALVRIAELKLEVFADMQAQIAAIPSEIAEMIEEIEAVSKETDKDVKLRVRRLMRSHSELINRMQVRITGG